MRDFFPRLTRCSTHVASPVDRPTRARSRRRSLCLESLEDRITLSLTPQMVLDINPGIASSSPAQFVAIGSTTYFTAANGVGGSLLWKSDGTADGTTLVKDLRDIFPTDTFLDIQDLTDVNGTLFFEAGFMLWKSDGTAEGTVFVKLLYPGRNICPSNLTNVNGSLFLTADDGYWGQELWKSDGTEGGTTLVKDIHPGGWYGYYGPYYPFGSYPNNLTNVNGTLFLSADDGTNGQELWKSDGTPTGTVRVNDINPGFSGSSPGSLTNVNGTLFFSANNGSNGSELWKSDGSPGGTLLIKDINPGTAGSSPTGLTNVNGTLFFSANNGSNGSELWKSDGNPGGTTLVKDINPGSASSSPGSLTNVKGTLFFTASNGTNGLELWKSDGTPAGTTLVKDINPGSASSSPSNLTAVNGTLFLTADDGSGVGRLWQSDGTPAGTVLITNLAARSLTNVNGALFFTADDGIHGMEPWKLVEDGLPPPPRLSISDVSIVEGNTGTSEARFTVTLLAASSQAVSVGYVTANGMATASSDYTAATGTLTFQPGETSKTVAVLVNGDRVGEPDETFFLNLSGPTNATLDDAQGVGTIIDDEPRIAVNDASVLEGNTGTKGLVFTVTLSIAYDEAVTVNFATANGTAVAGSDYTTTSGAITFLPGEMSKPITVLVKGDRLAEQDETLFVNLSGATNALLADSQGLGTIIDDEPRISIGDVTKLEGNSGTTSFVFTVTLSVPYDIALTVNFATANGTAKVSDGDYVATSGTLTFAPGQTTKTINVTVKGDTKKEANETLLVNLSGATNALILDSQGIGTILNDDGGKKTITRLPSRIRSLDTRHLPALEYLAGRRPRPMLRSGTPARRPVTLDGRFLTHELRA